MSSTPHVPDRRAPRRRRVRLACVGAAVATLGTLPLAGTATAADLVPGTPCGRDTAACVQLGNDGYNGKAWFIRDGRVVRGPVYAATGGPGQDTPTGTFSVLRKEETNFSSETTTAEGTPSPMPYSIFFTDSGYAFHGGGDPKARTAGCIRLANPDAVYFFSNLGSGDQVEIVDGSADVADRPERRRDDDDGDDKGGLLGGL